MAGGVERDILGVNKVLMIWIVGLGCGYRRKGRIVCFADAEKSDCDLVICWDAAKNIATRN